ncbi:hypothetical protein LUZ60_006675 [Juncus effusus]|nr:hypothetical protein LUZ60_006675 [Juncus effusus]
MEERQSRVAICGKSTAVSADPVQPGKIHEFTALDRSMSQHAIHLVYYYRHGPAMEDLKASLSEALSYYPAMTGRLVKTEMGEWFVNCNDAGVRTIDARADVTLDEWLMSATGEEERQLAYWEEISVEPFLWSPFYIQFTSFKDGAISIGLSCTHMHADPTCASLFMKAWSDCHRQSSISIPPFFHPSVFNPSKNIIPSSPLLSHKSTAASLPNFSAMSSVTFVFSAQSIRRFMSDLALSSTDISPFDALATLFWLRIIVSRGDNTGLAKLTVAVDFRGRMQASLPLGFYGNALHFSKAQADLSSGWGHVASELSRHVAGIKEDDFWSTFQWLQDNRKENSFQMFGPELTCLALDRVPVYSTEFDADVSPVHVTCCVKGAEGEGLIVVMPGPKEEGEEARTVMVTLPADFTAKIRQDEVILKYGPKVMFGPKV